MSMHLASRGDNFVHRAMPVREPVDIGRSVAARDVAAIEAALAATGRTILNEVAAAVETGRHYPDGEVWDPATDAQYFYHAHDPAERTQAEHGHFHTFLGQRGMPKGVAPLMLPEMALAQSPQQGRGVGTHRSPRDRGLVSHLIALSVDARGAPIALFTTNRWVTGETWFTAEDVVRMLPRFGFSDEAPHAVVSRWLAAVLHVLRPQIVALLAERDHKIMDWRRRRARQAHVFDDRRLEIVSSRVIDFPAELAAAFSVGPGSV